MYYYKQIDADGNTVGAFSCDIQLNETATQIAISADEYQEFINAIVEPEPVRPGYTISEVEINLAYAEGVQEA